MFLLIFIGIDFKSSDNETIKTEPNSTQAPRIKGSLISESCYRLIFN